jgi:hypothetical protein
MTPRYLLFVVALGFSTLLACRTPPLATTDGDGGMSVDLAQASATDLPPSVLDLAQSSALDLAQPSALDLAQPRATDLAQQSECAACATCNRGGPCCGNSCCGKGERCDPLTLTCHCGTGPACTNGNTCNSAGPAPFYFCGDYCCGATIGCPV